MCHRIPLSLGNKVSSRLLARATRALLAPGAGPLPSANGKAVDSDTLATTSSNQSASSTTELRDSPSAVALRNGDGNLTDSPTALGGSSQLRPSKPEPEQVEDPFIKDTEDLVRSMQTSSPSWNEEGNSSESASSGAPSISSGQGIDTQQPTDALRGSSGQDRHSSNGSSDKTYVKTGSAAPNANRLDRDETIDMVVFEKGEGRKSVESSVSSNGSSRL